MSGQQNYFAYSLRPLDNTCSLTPLLIAVLKADFCLLPKFCLPMTETAASIDCGTNIRATSFANETYGSTPYWSYSIHKDEFCDDEPGFSLHFNNDKCLALNGTSSMKLKKLPDSSVSILTYDFSGDCTGEFSNYRLPRANVDVCTPSNRSATVFFRLKPNRSTTLQVVSLQMMLLFQILLMMMLS